MLPRRSSFLAGLFLITLATLLLELLNTRLLSVITWYHLSFFAVSTAMFGMSAGAIRVYLGGDAFEGEAGRRELARYSGWLALAIPVSHIIVLCTPIRLGTSAIAIAGLVLALCLAVYNINLSSDYVSGVSTAESILAMPPVTSMTVYDLDYYAAQTVTLP